jgi:hypothetical protein
MIYNASKRFAGNLLGRIATPTQELRGTPFASLVRRSCGNELEKEMSHVQENDELGS